MQEKSVAIDGPAGAGKSTLARALARELGYLYVDTGAIYRTVALKALESSADPADPEQVVPLLDGLNVKMDHGPDGGQRMFLDGKDVSDAIRQHREFYPHQFLFSCLHSNFFLKFFHCSQPKWCSRIS